MQSPAKPPNREDRSQRRTELQAKDEECLLALGRKPLNSIESDDRELSHHEYLPRVGSDPLVCLRRNAEPNRITKHDGQSDSRHRDWKKRTRSIQQCSFHGISSRARLCKEYAMRVLRTEGWL